MTTDDVDISGLDKAEVLAALANATRNPMPFPRDAMTVAEAREVIASEGLRIDYVCHNRAIKANLAGASFNRLAFDRDSGQGAAEDAIRRLRRMTP